MTESQLERLLSEEIAGQLTGDTGNGENNVTLTQSGPQTGMQTAGQNYMYPGPNSDLLTQQNTRSGPLKAPEADPTDLTKIGTDILKRMPVKIRNDNYLKQMENMHLSARWRAMVAKMGEWYEKNVHTYQAATDGKARGQRKAYFCNLLGKKVFDDCSSFVKACLQLFGINSLDSLHITTSTMQEGSKFDNILLANDFERIPYDASELLPGDIICGGESSHTEIYMGDGKSYSWGNIHDGKRFGGKQRQGMPCKMAARIPYKWIWRYVGPNAIGDENNEAANA